ncbi:glycoside hydrolase family 32 protein [Mucilaginibacter pallidiroseus]|uniref:Glycoside hydrolase family 32 protein n=1 Tax=Mucilaginibacter pallidiroseus TaxID=2599295 RepID=A0A563UD56_9SPHI|nr:glycoside hydrolase family 32 protein [Mucilaginibacter pallidiroseus]TWR29297.1 glycoside hydrolase family 32 protein [Mucilaginibacter pallidiroseus]
MKPRHIIIAALSLIAFAACKQSGKSTAEAGKDTANVVNADSAYNEQYRLQAHWSPKAKWTNDPNGLILHNGTYHLFYQHYPDSTVWGPMHWGHATSKDLVTWKQQPIALYPDSLGYIFSGSIVADEKNTSGLGEGGKTPLVAIFTHHDPKGEKSGSSTYQNQSIAYSLDEGQTWTKYANNPVLKNPGIKDFRDPKVFWYAPQNKWLMSLATKDRITFYSSANLKNWKKESEFGEKLGGHGGVWECPDLISLKLNGKQYWVLLVSINPGGPNGGSATQYFVGNFDGNKFTPLDSQTRWIDYGPDDYAGVTFGGTGDRKIFLGWMGNWLYANQVPTKNWRNAMTIPRELSLLSNKGRVFLASTPVKELGNLAMQTEKVDGNQLTPGADVFQVIKQSPAQFTLHFTTPQLRDYKLVLANDAGEELVIGYDAAKTRYYIDRSKAGDNSFSKQFAGVAYAPRISSALNSDLKLVVDASSIELFADGGLSNLTSVFFPKAPYTHLKVEAKDMKVENMEVSPLKSIWK